MGPNVRTDDGEPQPVESITVTSADGTAIAVERSGDGPPLVLVHGTTADHGDWRSVRPTLAEAFTVYAIDRRGRGQSGDTDEYALEREFEDVAAVVESIDRPVFLLGHSFGGLCSLEAALRTDNVATLVLYEPLVPVGVGELVSPETLGRLETLLSDEDREAALVMFLREMVGLSDEEIDAIEGGPEWTTGLAAVHTVPRESRGLNRYLFESARFENLTTTTILFVGSESPEYLRQFTESVAEALPESRLVTLQGQGHTAMNTAPEEFARTVVELLG
jgi:pimeloyl-ACP methyl ester carboxylesterase